MKSAEYKDMYNANITIYENLKFIGNQRDSVFNEQIEQDILDYVFPKDYLNNQPLIRMEKMEEERLSMY